MSTIREHPQRVLYELLLMYVEQLEQLFETLGRGQSGHGSSYQPLFGRLVAVLFSEIFLKAY